MKIIISLILLTFSFASFSITCEDFKNDIEFKSLGREILNRTNWNTLDVLFNYDYDLCINTISQGLIEIEGERFWSFSTTDSRCDGGSIYGVIYSSDLKTPFAHVYSGNIYCENEWRDEERIPKQ